MPRSLSNRTHAAELLRSALVWDNHGCLPLRADAAFLPQLVRYRDSGVSVVSLNVGYANMSWVDHVRTLSFFRQWIGQRADTYCLLTTVAEIAICKSQGRLGVVFDVEGMCPVQDYPSRVETLYKLGVRWMLVAYNRNNAAGGGCLDVDTGLTVLGRAVIDEMQRVGMVLCLSHTGRRTALEALEYSTNPAIFSHSNPYGDTPHPRNVPDDLMRICALKGGVIGLSGIGFYLGANRDLVSRILHQLRYVIDLVGVEHVGLGLDYVFDLSELDEHLRLNPTLYPPGLSSDGLSMIAPEDLGEIVEGLGKDNLTDSQIRGVLGENWLRIAKRVWK